MGTVDESHDDVVHAGFHLDGNLRETLHDLSASLGPLAHEAPSPPVRRSIWRNTILPSIMITSVL